jgi:hypothetical protein
MIGNVEGYKVRREGSHYVVLNRSYPLKKENGLVRNARKNKSVFLAFDGNQYNYSNISTKEVMFHINLDEEELITKENVSIYLGRHTRSRRISSTRKTMRKTRFRGMFTPF